ncbi:MAG: site-specific integrase [Streptococcaceae bacterium]|jgi:integrase|nr:site-specific integrase [Streptococcaceae bacterium]
MENDVALFENFAPATYPTPQQQGVHVRALQSRRRRNLGEKVHEFESFQDNELIDYYILHFRNVYKKDNSLSENTKRTYFTDLYQFYDLMKLSFGQRNLQTTKIFTNLSAADIEFYFHLIVDGNVPTSEQRTYQNGQTRHIFKYVQYKPASSAKKITIVKQFVAWLYKHKIVKENLILGLPSVELSEYERPNRDIRFPDTQFILEYFYQQNKERFALFLLAATSGLRVGAIANIQMKDISYEYVVDGFYYVIKVKEKGDKWRESVHLPEIFDFYLNSRTKKGLDTTIGKATGPLFLNARGKSYTPTALSKAMSDWLKPLNLEFSERFEDMKLTAHIFRHAYAIYFREIAVKNPKTAQQIGYSTADIAASLGHANDKITKEVYLSHTLKKERDLGRFIKLEDFIPPFSDTKVIVEKKEHLSTSQVMQELKLENKNVFLRLLKEEYLKPVNLATYRLDKTYYFDKDEVEKALPTIEKLEYYQYNRFKKLGYLSISQLLKEFSIIDRKTVDFWIETGKIPFVQAGNSYLLAPNEVEKLLMEEKTAPEQFFYPFQEITFKKEAYIVLDIQKSGQIKVSKKAEVVQQFIKKKAENYSIYSHEFNQKHAFKRLKTPNLVSPLIHLTLRLPINEANFNEKMPILLDFIKQNEQFTSKIEQNTQLTSILELKLTINNQIITEISDLTIFESMIAKESRKNFKIIEQDGNYLFISRQKQVENLFIHEDLFERLKLKAKIEEVNFNEYLERILNEGSRK